MTKLAWLIAQEEGFFKKGSLPNRNNNPGDLRHSPHSEHPDDANAIGQIDTIEHGWEDLDRQLQLFADRGLTLKQAISIFAPPEDNNNTEAYIDFICNGLGITCDTLVSEAIKVQHV